MSWFTIDDSFHPIIGFFSILKFTSLLLHPCTLCLHWFMCYNSLLFAFHCICKVFESSLYKNETSILLKELSHNDVSQDSPKLRGKIYIKKNWESPPSILRKLGILWISIGIRDLGKRLVMPNKRTISPLPHPFLWKIIFTMCFSLNIFLWLSLIILIVFSLF